MTDPTKSCAICLRSRNCMRHANGRGFPPDKAENWLRKTCPNKGRRLADGSMICQISYRAGLGAMSQWVGQ